MSKTVILAYLTFGLKIFFAVCPKMARDQELSIEYHFGYFWTKIKNTKFSGHIWAQSQNILPKVFPIDGVFWPANISKK